MDLQPCDDNVVGHGEKVEHALVIVVLQQLLARQEKIEPVSNEPPDYVFWRTVSYCPMRFQFS